jgi:hypothetical protein
MRRRPGTRVSSVSRAWLHSRGFAATRFPSQSADRGALTNSAAATENRRGSNCRYRGSADRAAFVRGFFAADARLPAGEAVAWINKVEDRSERSLAMQTVATAWRGGDPARMETRRGMALNEEASSGHVAD